MPAPSLLPFTGHNIRLPDGTETKPGTPLIAENGICQAALRMLDLCFGEQLLFGRGKVRVADLGCLEGGYSAAFARAGYRVQGFEVRDANVARCRHVEDALKLRNLSFVRDDARKLHAWGEFDAVFCAGLLYHLDEPDAFLRMLGKVTRRLLIVQTHVALVPDTVHEGRRGTWHADNPGDGDPWGSHGNTRSFWMAKPDLLQAIRDAGFDLVLEQYDYLPDIAGGPSGTANPANPEGGADRVMVAGVKL